MQIKFEIDLTYSIIEHRSGHKFVVFMFVNVFSFLSKRRHNETEKKNESDKKYLNRQNQGHVTHPSVNNILKNHRKKVQG